MLRITSIFLLSFIGLSGFSQVAINSNGDPARPSAMLDVESTNKGMLVPRMTRDQRVAITTPATGLLVYDTDSSRFYYFDGVWNTLANQHKLGGESSYADFEDDGTLIFYGSSTTYEDLQVPGLAMALKNNGNAPELTSFIDNTQLYAFHNESSDEDEVVFTIQIPHAWKEGTIIYPHVHFVVASAPSLTSTVKWGLEYTWANVNESFPATTETIIYAEADSIDQRMHEVVGFKDANGDSGIDGTDKKISSMLVCRLFRNSTDDSYAGNDVFLLQFDIHYEVNTNGSRLQWIK